MKKTFVIFILFLLITVNSAVKAAVYSRTAIDAYNLGVQQTKAKAYNSAIISFKKAVTIEPTFADAYYNLGYVYFCLKQYDNAIATHLQLLKINPKDYDAMFELAKIYNLRQKYLTEVKYLSAIPQSYTRYQEVARMKKEAERLLAIQKQKETSLKTSQTALNKKVVIDKFSSPTGLATDTKGNIYVACYSDNSIMKIESNKKAALYIKTPLIKGPIGIAIDSLDNIYVANYEGNNIIKINPQGKISIFLDKIYKPYYLYIKGDILYISEQATNTVIKYNLR